MVWAAALRRAPTLASDQPPPVQVDGLVDLLGHRARDGAGPRRWAGLDRGRRGDLQGRYSKSSLHFEGIGEIDLPRVGLGLHVRSGCRRLVPVSVIAWDAAKRPFLMSDAWRDRLSDQAPLEGVRRE